MELNGNKAVKSPKKLNSPERMDKQSEQNSFMTLAIPTIDRESTFRQSASKLIKVDENGSQVF